MKTLYSTSIFAIFLTLLVAELFVSCDDFTDVDLPNSQLNTVTVFEDNATATAALTSIYSKIRDNGLLAGTSTGLSHQLGNYTDELTYYGNPLNTTFNFYNNTLLASNGDLSNLWGSTYNQIYAANAVIDGVALSTKLTESQKNQLTGEALFVRGLLHFYLTNLYGAVPYVTTTDYLLNSTVGKQSVSTVYGLVKNDLVVASSLLSDAYVTDERVRPNKFTVRALLARVCLYNGDWAEASNEASSVLNATDLYVWNTDLSLEFLSGSLGTIWQLMPSVSGKNTEEAVTFIFTSGPPPGSALTDSFVASFDGSDARKTELVGSVTSGSETWYYPNKYKEADYTGGSVEYSIVFRLAEQYLIRAEARAYQGDLIGAREDLNVVRSRAGLAATLAVTSADVIASVLEERKFELFTEFGHRFFDLKRMNKLNTVLGTLKPGWDVNDRLFPLPSSELILNPNLSPQNEGY